jgi:metal-dependent amidase/aminoacylase/carboxypeptidase family protein
MAWMQTARQLVVEKCPSDVPQVLTFGRFEALGSTNVVSANAVIKGTFRTMNEQWRAEVKSILKETAAQVSAAYGATIDVQIGEGYPFLKNDLELTHKVKNILEKELGTSNVSELGLRMTAEDFAFYSQQRPVCFFRLGTSRPDQSQAPAVHHPKFDIDEKALEIGVQCMVAIGLS